MSVLSPLKFRGVKYETPKQVKEAKRQRSIDVIEHNIGVRGIVTNLLLDKETKKKIISSR